jgi:flagellar basal-body rod protein FlgC
MEGRYIFMAFMSSLDIAGSGLTAQKRRLDTITENLVNKDTTRTDEGGPYRRKLVVFREIDSTRGFRSQLRYAKYLNRSRTSVSRDRGVMVPEIIEDQSEFIPVYDPNHPDSNDEGYVMMPNVNTTIEMVDAMAASRSYSANIAALEAVKSMATKALQIGR